MYMYFEDPNIEFKIYLLHVIILARICAVYRLEMHQSITYIDTIFFEELIMYLG